MKKIISRLGVKDDQLSCNNSNSFVSLVGRQLHVGARTVTIEELIAEGGFGVVFKVRDSSHCQLALKRICVNNEDDLLRCNQEIDILKSISHKNIARLIDTGVVRKQNGIYEMLMLFRYYRDNVADLIEECISSRTFLKEFTISKILCDMCEAVGCLHKERIIHRDLKIENILIDDYGNYVLCDFGSATMISIFPRQYGISKAEEEISKYTTLSYRSPEMVDLYSDKQISTKADIWALGCLLYALCFLKLPFKDSIIAIQAGEYSIPQYPEYGDNILKLIGYMLQVIPDERPDIYQVSVIAFKITTGFTTPLPNINNSFPPKVEDLPMPFKEGDLRTQKLQQSSAPSPSTTSELIKTSILPRQRPRVPGVPSVNKNSLQPPSRRARGHSSERRDIQSCASFISSSFGGPIQNNPFPDNKNSHLVVSEDDDTALMIDSESHKNATSVLSHQQSTVSSSINNDVLSDYQLKKLDFLHDSANLNTNTNSASLGELDLLRFDVPTCTHLPGNSKHESCRQNSISNVHLSTATTNDVSIKTYARHRRLQSDTSAVTGISMNYIKPPVTSHTNAQLGIPQLRIPVTEPLTSSVSMDYIRMHGGMHFGSYQLPSQAHPQLQQQPFIPYSNSPMCPVTNEMKCYNATFKNPNYQNRHQMKYALQKEENRLSRTTDLINFSENTPDRLEKLFLQPPTDQTHTRSATISSNLKNNRAASAMDLDMFGSVPFSSLPLPSRPQTKQAHTRSASQGQTFPEA